MKRIFLFAALCATVLFTSCNKDKDPQELIVGKWKVSKLIADGEDIILGSVDYKTAVELEFTNGGSVVFTVKALDLTTTPPTEDNFVAAGSYTWSGDNQITLTVTNDGETMTVTGNIDVTENKLTFTGTSGDIEDFITSMEADKI